MNKSLGTVALLGMLCSLQAHAGQPQLSPSEWMSRMSQAVENLDYQGTFVYVHTLYSGEQSIESMRITHVNTADGTRERLHSITGPQREIIRTDKAVKCVFAEDRSVLVDNHVGRSLLPVLPLDDVLSSSAQYSLKMGVMGRVAGRQVQAIKIRPRDKFRYGYTLWLDVENGLPLKSVLHDANEQGSTLARLMFTDIRFGDAVDQAELNSTVPEERFELVSSPIPMTKAVSTDEMPRWSPAKVPSGFRLTSHNHEERENSQGMFEHLVYSDGLATVSIYIETLADGQQAIPGLSSLGGMNAYVQQKDTLQITGIGEVPAITVKTLVDNVTQVASEKSAHSD